MKFGFLYAVKDINAARAFYEELFGLTVFEDYGEMVSFDCGLVLQQDFDRIVGMPKADMKVKENNCMICTEQADFDGFVKMLRDRNDITFFEDVKECTWGQRVIHFYDLDNHLIEVGESMKTVVNRFLAQGMSEEEAAVRMDIGTDDVRRILKE